MDAKTHLTTTAAAVAIRNRLERDLDTLTRSAKSAGTLPADETGLSLDLALNLDNSVKSLTAAIANLNTMITTAQRAERLALAAAAADEFNSAIFAN
jgi:hypothetical protein